MKKFFFIPVVFLAAAAAAQQSDTRAWIGIQLPVNFSDKWQWHNDAGYRTIGLTGSAYQYLCRTGVRYLINKEWSIAAGTAFFFTRNSYKQEDHEFGRELRLWEEINFNKAISKKISLQNRVRLEERWFDATANKTAYYGFRFRYRVAGTQKLSARWSVQLANEYMQQASKHKFSFNQNRLIATAIYKVNEPAQLQAGYMWLLQPGISAHVIVITVQKNIWIHGNGNKRNH